MDPVVLAVSGASAQPLAQRAQHLFWRERTGTVRGTLRCHRWHDQAAAIASGSYRTRAMVNLPASMGTVGRIAAGMALDLIEWVADVHLKQGRPLLIGMRELPWNLVDLLNLTRLAEGGARIAPPVPAWYHQPTSLEEMVDFLVVRVFDCLGYDLGRLRRWQGPPSSS